MEAILILLLVAGAWFWDATPSDEAISATTSNPVEASTAADAAAQAYETVGCRLADQPARYRDLTRPWPGDRVVSQSRTSATPQ